jgi:CRP-like cAMP-binding protein
MQTDDAASVLAGADFFEICSDDERRLLGFASERKFYPAGTVIAAGGDVPVGAHVLISGSLAVEPDAAPAARRVVTQAGAVVSATALLIGRPSSVTVRALSGAVTLLVPRHAFLKLLNQSPELARRATDRTRQELLDFMGAVTPFGKKITKE